jgi:hypothetical protein
MKSQFKFALILTFFALFSFYSCQDEVIEETPINEEELIVPESQLANLMMSTSFNNSTVDDILDEANCFSVNLPVTIVANGITITIDTQDDLELLEEIFDEFTDDDDVLEFFFPITIILNDHTEVQIENKEELEAFVLRCEEIDEEVIECVDFIYPISFSLYDAQFQIIDVVEIRSERELHQFFKRLREDNQNSVVLASLNFPVELEYADGSTKEIHNNIELARALSEAKEDCDINKPDCTKEFLSRNLLECDWRIYSYNDESHFRPYLIDFKVNNDLVIKGENDVVAEGKWETGYTAANRLVVHIDGITNPNFAESLEGRWFVVECGPREFKLVREGTSTTTRVVIKKLKNCRWYSGSNLSTSANPNGPFMFGDENVVIAYTADGEVTGYYKIELRDNGILILLEFPEPYQYLNKAWKVYQCGPERIKLIDGDHYVVFEKDCNEYDCVAIAKNIGDECERDGKVGFINENCECQIRPVVFECYESYTKTICDDDVIDGFTEFNLNELFPNCNTDEVELTFHKVLSYANEGIEALPAMYTNISNPQTIYARVTQAGTANFEVFEVELKVENCDGVACTEADLDNILNECHWEGRINNSNDFVNFDFYFDNENKLIIEGSEKTYLGTWVTLAGTENPIVNITELNGDFSIFNGEWVVVECADTQLLLHGPNNMELALDRDCDDEQTPNALSEKITSGQWLVAKYNDSGVDETTDYSNWVLEFKTDGTVTASNNNTISGTWSANYHHGELHIELNFGGQLPFDEFNDNWNVFSLAVDRIELRDISGGDYTLDVLVFEKI